MIWNPDAMLRLWWLIWFGDLVRPRKKDDDE